MIQKSSLPANLRSVSKALTADNIKVILFHLTNMYIAHNRLRVSNHKRVLTCRGMTDVTHMLPSSS
jgi:hypothetical protein